jgi:alkylation response protein AidB-like acyl-CoA dehydrogenase
MDFSYSEEQQEVKALAAKILGDQTENEQLRAIDEQEDRFDPKLWRDLAEAGLLGVAIDEAHGGMGFGFETLCLLAEEVGRTVAPTPVVPVLVSAASSLQKFADKSVCERYLPKVASGDALITAALVEPGNDDARTPGARAECVDEQWRISGAKHCVPFARQSEAILVTATTAVGLGVFLLDPDGEGVTLNRQIVTAGEPQFEVTLENAAAQIIAQGEQAEAMAQWMVEATIAANAAMATGLCDAMMRMTASYASERQQFGVPIATFQAVGHQQADSFIDVECLRLVAQQAISLLDQGQDASAAVQVAKVWTGDACHRVSQNSQQCHGGIGVDRDYPLFRFCLWARQLELSCGSSARTLAGLGESIAAEYAA